MRAAVIGAGAMGAALALTFERSGNEVALCGTTFDTELIRAIERDRTHPGLGHWVPESISTFDAGRWDEGLKGADVVALAVASVGLRAVAGQAAPFMDDDAIWVIATKGWEPGSAQPLSRVLREVSPHHPIVVLVGPSLAAELASGTPTGLVCASQDPEAAATVAAGIDCPSVRAFITDDVAGVEVGAALKNVLAIAIGMCDGITEAKGRAMTNTKAALFSRGLVEMARLSRAMGGRDSTVLGLAGAGDLFVTVLGGRNGRFGRLIGAGLDPEKAFNEMGTTVEGYDNARQALQLAERLDLDLPVVRMVHSVLFEGVSAEAAIDLLARAEVEPEM